MPPQLEPVYTLVRLAPGRENLVSTLTPEETQIVKKHNKYLRSLRDEGIVVHAGRTTDESRLHWLIIMRATEARAAGLMEQDPAVRAGLQQVETFPYVIVI
jgi:uncharacterized protein YciI